MKPKLSFCIPTYNRGQRVFECVTHILKHPSKEIEVVVCDNNSPDNTKEILKKIKDKRFKYHKNKTNLGFSKNLIKVLKKAKGEFLFLLSDEDLVNIKIIKQLLRTNSKIGVVYGSIKNNNRYYYKFKNKLVKEKENKLKFIFNHRYMSGIILNSKYLNFEEAKKFENKKEFYYPHVFFILQCLEKGPLFTFKDVFCFMGKIEKSFMSEINKKKYYHIENRLLQLKLDLEILRYFKINYNKSKPLNKILVYYISSSILFSLRREKIKTIYNYYKELKKTDLDINSLKIIREFMYVLIRAIMKNLKLI